MPNKPRKNQSKSSYMSSCVRDLKKEGKSPGKAKDMCYAAWMSYKGKSKKKKKKKRKK